MRNSSSDDEVRMNPNYGWRKIFSQKEENEVKKYVLTYSKMNYGITKADFKKLVYEVALKNNKKIPSSWHTKQSAGDNWYCGFIKRHPNLSLRRQESCSLARATAFNKHYVQMFYDKLKRLDQEYPTFSHGSRVYNLDETSTSTVAKPGNVLAEKDVKQVSQVSCAERGTLVTACCIINAPGSSLPPVMVFPRKHPKKWMIADTPAATLGLASPLGWMIAELFLEVMQDFIKYEHASKENPALPIFDNHASHILISVIELAKESGVH